MIPEDEKVEVGYTLEEFVDVWRRINGSWDPDEEIIVYERARAQKSKLLAPGMIHKGDSEKSRARE